MLKRVLRTSIVLVPILLSLFGAWRVGPNFRATADSTFPTGWPLLYVDPANMTGNVGDVFTISLKIYNLVEGATIVDPDHPQANLPIGDLFAWDLNFTWDPAILEYVSHTLTEPIESYPGGVLHTGESGDPLVVLDKLNESRGYYRSAVSTYAPALPFNNANASNTILNMTFRVKAEGATELALARTAPGNPEARPAKLSSEGAQLIYYEYRKGHFETEGVPQAHFSVLPSDGYAAANKTVTFDASGSEPSGQIDLYMWDFGDGQLLNTTDPIVEHIYTATGAYSPRLRVRSIAGISSAWTTGNLITVVARREIEVLFFTFSSPMILWNDTLGIGVTVMNKGQAPENLTIWVYYNATTDDGWTYIGEEQVNGLAGGTQTSVPFTWNTSELAGIHSYYRFLANTTTVPQEENVTNNRLDSGSNVVELIVEPYHDLALMNFGCTVVVGADQFGSAAIIGETVRVDFQVKGNGTYDEVFDVFANVTTSDGETLATVNWTSEQVNKYNIKAYNFTVNATVAGNLTVAVSATIAQVDSNPENNNLAGRIRVMNPPHLNATYSQEQIIVEQNVTFSAAASYQEGGQIIAFLWRTHHETDGPDQFSNDQSGETATYALARSGNWTIRLRATDIAGITYDPTRPLSAPYRLDFSVTAKGEEFPIEWIILPVVGIVAAAIVGYLLYRRTRPKQET
jgi:hypothetical protein